MTSWVQCSFNSSDILKEINRSLNLDNLWLKKDQHYFAIGHIHASTKNRTLISSCYNGIYEGSRTVEIREIHFNIIGLYHCELRENIGFQKISLSEF